MNQNLTYVTDDRGRPMLDGDDAAEPLPGSVVLTDGEFGTAWQRYFADGMWHRVGGGSGRGKPWSFFLSKRNVVLAYDAHERIV